MATLSPRLARIVDALPLQPGMRVLEIGCGPGAAAREVARRLEGGHILAIDRSPRAIALARRTCTAEIQAGRLSLRQVAIEEFELEPGEEPFGLASAVRVGMLDGRHPRLEQQALEKIARALRPNGRLFLDGGDPLREVTLRPVRPQCYPTTDAIRFRTLQSGGLPARRRCRMPDGAWLSCPHYGSSVKRLENHIRKAHEHVASSTLAAREALRPVKRTRRGSAKKKEQREGRPTGPVFVKCEYCPSLLGAHLYANHVRRRHPGRPVRWRPALAEQVSKSGLPDDLRAALSQLPVDTAYRQRYRPWYREIQGGAPGTGRRR